MLSYKVSFVALAASLLLSACSGSGKMTKDEWQREMNEETSSREHLRTELASLTKDVDSLKALLASLDKKIAAANEETMAMVGASQSDISNFDVTLGRVEAHVQSLSMLSHDELFKSKGEINGVQAEKDSLSKEKMAAIPRFYHRLQTLQSRINDLRTTLASTDSGEEKVYVVGSWSKNRDCLWNIAKKKNIYNDPYLWPKIWQANRDQIKNPDEIERGEKLRIPHKSDLNAKEKVVLRHYWKEHPHT